MARHKAQQTSPSHTRACPLCRSAQPTGLTPSGPPPQPPLGRAFQGGFVSGRQLHGEMVRRASAARLAVQRSLAAHQPGAASPSAVFFASPGAAYEAVSRTTRPLASRFASDGASGGDDDAATAAGGAGDDATAAAATNVADVLEGSVVMEVAGHAAAAGEAIDVD
jgi:hypothetical protein